jgi:peptidoglycan/LPS O-acetylase OafA/YrhL
MGSLRFMLASTVAGGHAASMFGFAALWILPRSRAVQIFYIISGFLMAMILNEKYPDTPQGNWTFLTNRAIKIFVPYLTILATTILICLASEITTGDALLLRPWFAEAGVMTFSTGAFAALTNLFIVGQEWGYLLIYHGGSLAYALHATSQPPVETQFTIIGPAWTLSLELMFYAMAPFLLRRNLLLLVALAGTSQVIRLICYRAGYFSDATDYRFFPFELGLFLYGSICFRLGRLIPAVGLGFAAVGTAAVILTIVLLPPYLLEHRYKFDACIGLLLPVLLDFGRKARWDRSLSELSYPLYLVHWPVVAVLAMLTTAVTPNAIGTVWAFPCLAVAASMAAAALVERYVVNPIDQWRQARAGFPLGRPATSAIATGRSGASIPARATAPRA